MNDDLDALLRDGLLQVPTDFAQRVMKRMPPQIQPLPRAQAHGPAHATQHRALPTAQRPAVWPRVRRLAARAGWAGAGLLGFVLGLDQLAAFVFGLWLAGAAL